MVMRPFSTLSRRKWCLISICLVRECCTGFLEILIALVLSHMMGTVLKDIPKSSSCCLSQSTWEQQAAAAMYSASAVERATEFCFFEDHDTRQGPSSCAVPEVLFLSLMCPAQSASVYPTRSNPLFLGYQRHRLVCSFEVSKDPFDCLHVRFHGVCLKASTKAYTEHDIGSTSCEVQ